MRDPCCNIPCASFFFNKERRRDYFSPKHSIGLPQQTSAPAPAIVTSTSLPHILHLYLCPTFVILPPFMITTDRSRLCVYLFEHVLACPAERTRPVIRKVLKSSSGRYLPLPVPLLLVIDISAVSSLTLPHNILLLLDCIRSLFQERPHQMRL